MSGDWSSTSRVNKSSRTVRGATSGADFHQTPKANTNPGEGFDNFVDMNPTTTRHGRRRRCGRQVAGLYALLIPDLIITQDILDPLQIRVWAGHA